MGIVSYACSDRLKMEGKELWLVGACHCGAVRLRIPAAPKECTRCNCSLCRRLAATWAYFPFGTVQVEGHPQNTQEYVQGDRMLRTIHCATCGCVTHWEPVDPEAHPKHGVNMNNFPPQLIDGVRIRRIDGADTWQYLD